MLPRHRGRGRGRPRGRPDHDRGLSAEGPHHERRDGGGEAAGWRRTCDGRPLPHVARSSARRSCSNFEAAAPRRHSRPRSRSPPSTSIVAVASGKGGVGKSSVTVNLACALAAEGHRVGVLDADVWGFSVPRMLGVQGKPVGFNDMILPLEGHGVKVISMGFFVPGGDAGDLARSHAAQGDRAVPGRRLLGRPRLPALRPAAGNGRRVDLAGVVHPGRVDARRHHAAGGRAEGGRARRARWPNARTCARSA